MKSKKEFMEKLTEILTERVSDKPLTKGTIDGLNTFISQFASAYSQDASTLTIQYIDSETNSTINYSTTIHDYDTYIKECKLILLAGNLAKTNLVPITEERIEEYIQDNYDRYAVKEYGSYIYQMIQEKAYDFASEVIEEAKEEYDILDEDSVIEAIMEEIDFDSLYELIEDILNIPITMEEKLADVGMSMKDFL